MRLETIKHDTLAITRAGCYLALFLAGIVAFGFTSNCVAGAYIFAGNGQSVDIVTHPKGYNGTGGIVTVGVCLNPGGADLQIESQKQAIVNSIKNVISTYNSLQVTTGNVKIDDPSIPIEMLDFESTALHEVGHCIGLGHPNLGAQDFNRNNRNYTNLTNLTYSTKGANRNFDFDQSMGDGIYGNGDDRRADDINLHWFRKSDNNPFAIASVVDSTTYSRDLADLPVGLGYTYATNADRTVAERIYGLSNTEAVMQQGTRRRETQRTLNADDVATLRYAMSGDDESAGTSDDYTIKLVYRDFATGGPCDITLKFDNATSLALCRTTADSPAANKNHMRITSADIFFVNDPATWHFNNTPNVADTTPDSFNFNNVTNAPRNSVITSNMITVTGLNVSTSISVIGGEYSINGNTFSSNLSSVNNLDTVMVRHTSSSSINTTTQTTLTIGGISRDFNSITPASTVSPDQFTFIDQNEVRPNTVIVSNNITLSGIRSSAAIIVSGGEYSVNGNDFTVSTGLVFSSDSIVVRHTSSSRLDTPVNTVLTIGATSDTFTSRTTATDSIPDNFRFDDQTRVALNSMIISNSISVTGLAVPAVISISNGTFQINGGNFNNTQSLIGNGATIRVRHVSSARFATNTNTTLTIGGISDTFTSTTLTDSSRRKRDNGGGGGFTMLLILFATLSLRGIFRRSAFVRIGNLPKV